MRLVRTLRMKPTVAVAVLLMAGLSGCGGAGDSESKMTSYSGGESKNDTAQLFTVPAPQMAHLQIVTVEKSRLPRVLRLPGAVAYNAFKTTPVFSAVGGPVEEILVAPGQIVRAGEPLLTVASPDYSASRSNFMKAQSTFQLAEKNYQRSLDLYAHHAIAERDLQQAESDRAEAQADLESSEDALRVLGIKDPAEMAKAPRKGSARIAVNAPVSGEITERLVGPGQLLTTGATQCFTISDMSTVWVLLNVYQSDMGYVHNGDNVEINTETYPETFHGKISYVSPALDASTHTLQVRIVAENHGDRLKKDMYVIATVQAGAIADALTVPDAAVLHDTENQPFVYVQAGSNRFARRVVQTGESQNGRTQITSGLKEGEHLVSDGSLFLQFKNSLEH
jgi:cobalt-zinc-cadmium efflux system membrane fusion protein